MSASGEWTGGLALLVRRPAAGARPAPPRPGGLPVVDFDAPPLEIPDAAAAVAAEAEVAARAQEARVQAARD